MGNNHQLIPAEERFWPKVQKTDGCWEWIGARQGPNGYGNFYYNGQAGTAHRYSYQLHYGPIPDGLQVLHTCDNRPCVRPDHLFAGSHVDNMRDMLRKGREANGERSGSRKITAVIARAIWACHATGEPLDDIAARYGVSVTTVSVIGNGKTWKRALAELDKEAEAAA